MAGSRRGEEPPGAAPPAETDEKGSAAGTAPPAEDDGSLLFWRGSRYDKSVIFVRARVGRLQPSERRPAAKRGRKIQPIWKCERKFFQAGQKGFRGKAREGTTSRSEERRVGKEG